MNIETTIEKLSNALDPQALWVKEIQQRDYPEQNDPAARELETLLSRMPGRLKIYLTDGKQAKELKLRDGAPTTGLSALSDPLRISVVAVAVFVALVRLRAEQPLYVVIRGVDGSALLLEYKAKALMLCRKLGQWPSDAVQ